MVRELQDSIVYVTLETLTIGFIFTVGILVMIIMVAYTVDITQKQHAIRRNYPVIGHFRYLFEHVGEFFRQYFFAMDREELSFNRAQRSWAYRAAKNLDNTVAFGSTRDLKTSGSVLFVNCPYPTLGEDAIDASPVTIGPYCDKPWTTSALFGVSGMSWRNIKTRYTGPVKGSQESWHLDEYG